MAPEQVSLGQYLEIEGGGFVGGPADQVTLLHLIGQYTRDGTDTPIDIDTLLVPEFVSGSLVRYVLNEDDDLGQLGLRESTGSFSGTVAPIVSYGEDEVNGAPLDIDVRLAPVVQVVYLNFTQQYISSLQHFGLRAADELIRQRVLDVVQRDYRTINVEVRTEPPADFSLYSEVEVGGPDPNGLGLLGYDNTPGKDVGNLRLYDRIGGVNATTQADGFPGYGGVFVESLFTFSRAPERPRARLAGGGRPVRRRVRSVPARPERRGGGAPPRRASWTRRAVTPARPAIGAVASSAPSGCSAR